MDVGGGVPVDTGEVEYATEPNLRPPIVVFTRLMPKGIIPMSFGGRSARQSLSRSDAK